MVHQFSIVIERATIMLTASEAHGLLVQAGFERLHHAGSHRVYGEGSWRIVIPAVDTLLHPKIAQSVFMMLEPLENDPTENR
jgi:predicted RNA binding protein YcfA (HicA-like mRNA interferase family)